MASGVNPFNPYYPASARIFANRGREQDFFRQGLEQGLHPAGPGPWNVALLGPWGIGKTSLLRRFAQLTAEFEPRALAVTLTVTSAVADPHDLAATLLIRAQEEILAQTRWPERLRSELARWQPSVSLGPLRAARQGAPQAAAAPVDLYRELARLWRDHLHERVAGMVVLLDDAHLLLTRDPGALLSLRAAFQDLQGGGARYPLVVTGPEDLFAAVRDVSEPVTRFFERMALGPFSPADTAEAVRTPLAAVGSALAVESDAVDLLWSLTGGHPFFVTFAMRDLFSRAAGRLTAGDVDAAWPAIAAHLASERFLVEWQSATVAEREVLRALVDGGSGASVTRTVGRSAATLLTRLLRKGLIVRTARGEYDVYHPLFAAFVRASRGL